MIAALRLIALLLLLPPAAARASDSRSEGDAASSPARGGRAVRGVARDVDRDGVPDHEDNCPRTPNADQQDSECRVVAGSGRCLVASGLCYVVGTGVCDLIGDGVGDACDACVLRFNPAQRDDDGDGFGNRCDADVNNNCIVGERDLEEIWRQPARPAAPSPYDVDEDGAIGPVDVFHAASMLGHPPGPSGLAGARCTPDPSDADDDGVPDAVDNCPHVSNAQQLDSECAVTGTGSCYVHRGVCHVYDGTGSCEVRSDGVGDLCDVCVDVPDPDQRDTDGDGIGDRCERPVPRGSRAPTGADVEGAVPGGPTVARSTLFGPLAPR